MNDRDGIPMRVIPTLTNDSVIVRCQCRLRHPSGEMIKCSRCGCFCHQKCVKIRDPFVCPYCYIASQKILLDRFYKTSTASGAIIDRSKLHNCLINDKDLFQVCELREHSYACGHISELLRNLITYMSSLDLSLCNLARHFEDPVYDSIRDKITLEIAEKRKLYVNTVSVLMKTLEKYEKVKNNQELLPDLRDAIIQELL